MPIVGLSVTKECAFRDSVQPFSNVYFYNNFTGSLPSDAGALSMIDEVVAWEKTVHSTGVTFTYARIWSQGLTEFNSQMIEQKSLTGNGTSVHDNTLDRERAYLVRWRAGSDSRGNAVYLRKWYHTLGQFASAPLPTSTVYSNTTGLSTATKDAIATKCQQIATLSAGGGGWQLCAKSGRGYNSNSPQSHPYLEHHQLGDQWRGD